MNNLKIDTDSKPIEEQFEDLVQAADIEYPNLLQEVEVFISHTTELQSYQEYLNLINQTPDAFVSNTATPA